MTDRHLWILQQTVDPEPTEIMSFWETRAAIKEALAELGSLRFACNALADACEELVEAAGKTATTETLGMKLGRRALKVWSAVQSGQAGRSPAPAPTGAKRRWRR